MGEVEIDRSVIRYVPANYIPLIKMAVRERHVTKADLTCAESIALSGTECKLCIGLMYFLHKDSGRRYSVLLTDHSHSKLDTSMSRHP